MDFDSIINKLYKIAAITKNHQASLKFRKLARDVAKNGLPDEKSLQNLLIQLNALAPTLPEKNLAKICYCLFYIIKKVGITDN